MNWNLYVVPSLMLNEDKIFFWLPLRSLVVGERKEGEEEEEEG